MNILIIPVGSFEQHGPHLPPTTDAIIAEAIANEICRISEATTMGAIPASCSHEHHEVGIGAVSSDPCALLAYIGSLIHSALDGHWDRVVLLNCHGGNYLLANLVQQINSKRGPKALLAPHPNQIADAFATAGIETSINDDMHGGEWETSITLAVRPDLVRIELARDVEAIPRKHLLLTGMGPLTDSGVIGRPTLATEDKGRRGIESLAAQIVKEIHILGWLTE